MPSQLDLDQGGTYRGWVRQYLGPTLGWTEFPGQNILQITSPGTYVVGPDTSLVTVNVPAGAVTIQLPTQNLPPSQVTQPRLCGNVPITIVDIGGHAQVNPITIVPASLAETIMGLAAIQVTVNYGSFVFNPNPPNLATQVMGSSPLTSSAGGRPQRSVTASPVVAAPLDQILNVNINSGSPTLALPLAATRNGLPLTIKDVGSQFAAHNLTVTAAGGDTIDGNLSLVLNVNRAAVTLVPFNDGINTGWAIE